MHYFSTNLSILKKYYKFQNNPTRQTKLNNILQNHSVVAENFRLQLMTIE